MGFFDGEDFQGDFKALMPEYYPVKYKKYIQEETNLLKSHLDKASRVLEAGVGIGRLIPIISPLVGEFVGVDNTDLMLKESEKVLNGFSNVKLIKCNLEDLDKLFPSDYFEYALCVWNTLGNVQDEAVVLKQISTVTEKSVFVTVYNKGTIEDRINWYETVGIEIKDIDLNEEVFYSESGLKSKSYSLDDLQKIVKKVDLKIIDSKVLGEVVLRAEIGS